MSHYLSSCPQIQSDNKGFSGCFSLSLWSEYVHSCYLLLLDRVHLLALQPSERINDWRNHVFTCQLRGDIWYWTSSFYMDTDSVEEFPAAWGVVEKPLRLRFKIKRSGTFSPFLLNLFFAKKVGQTAYRQRNVCWKIAQTNRFTEFIHVTEDEQKTLQFKPWKKKKVMPAWLRQ